jgi:hypothetical protein
MEIAIDEHGTQRARILVSVLAWNGKPILGSPSKMMKRIYGSFSRWQLLTHCHEEYKREDKAMELHELSTPCLELKCDRTRIGEVMEVTASDGYLVRTRAIATPDFSEFLRVNSRYLESLKAYLCTRTVGLA